MSTIDEVLAAAEVVDAVCIIDGETRIISVPTEYKELGVESDEKVTRIKFQCPKIVGDNIDLTEYNLYINYRNAGNKLNSYLVEDATVTGDTINFSWLLSRHVTESPGTISYIVCAKKSDYTGVINEWNTKVATGTVGVGLEATEEIEEQNIDIIEQILRSIVELENKVDGGGSGGSGEDGGYYTPAVTQTTEKTMQVSFTPSKTTMPAVSGTEITLPTGPKGVSGVYVGSGDMPDGYNVQIDPNGTPDGMPTTLPNPHALTFTGAVTGSYDGSAPLSVEIPSGGGAQSESYSVTYQTDEISEDVTSISLPINDTDMLWKILNADYLTIKAYVTRPSDGTATGAVWFGIDTNFITKYITFCKNKKILVGGAGTSTVTLVKYIERMPVSKENISVDNKIGGNVNSTGRNCIIHILNRPENSNTVDDSVLKSRIGLYGTARFLLTCDTPVGAGSYIKVTAEKGEVLNA